MDFEKLREEANMLNVRIHGDDDTFLGDDEDCYNRMRNHMKEYSAMSKAFDDDEDDDDFYDNPNMSYAERVQRESMLDDDDEDYYGYNKDKIINVTTFNYQTDKYEENLVNISEVIRKQSREFDGDIIKIYKKEKHIDSYERLLLTYYPYKYKLCDPDDIDEEDEERYMTDEEREYHEYYLKYRSKEMEKFWNRWDTLSDNPKKLRKYLQKQDSEDSNLSKKEKELLKFFKKTGQYKTEEDTPKWVKKSVILYSQYIESVDFTNKYALNVSKKQSKMRREFDKHNPNSQFARQYYSAKTKEDRKKVLVNEIEETILAHLTSDDPFNPNDSIAVRMRDDMYNADFGGKKNKLSKKERKKLEKIHHAKRLSSIRI